MLLCTKLPYNKQGICEVVKKTLQDYCNTVTLSVEPVFVTLFGHFYNGTRLTAWEAGMDKSNIIVGIAYYNIAHQCTGLVHVSQHCVEQPPFS